MSFATFLHSTLCFLHSTLCFLPIHSQSQSRSSFSILLVLDFTLSLIQLVRLTILFFVQIQVNHSQSLYLVLATRNIVGDGAQTQYDLQCHRLQVVRTIRCLTSLLWGAIVDRIGRKPVILAGIISVVIFNTLFGLSKSFWMAILTRFLLGCFNGFLGPMRNCISTTSHVVIGLIIGPSLRGYFAQPVEKYPNIFPKNSFWDNESNW
ncbi:uncharacterized protein [Phaseolus vulgaris]|uniref:uncharacterized protein n=1 Tax=Phaseolus vulgaris TaxID=3885 RepID=UPI0035C9BC67